MSYGPLLTTLLTGFWAHLVPVWRTSSLHTFVPWVFLRTRPGHTGGTGAPRKDGAGNKAGLPSPVGPTQQGQQGLGWVTNTR